MYTYIGDLCHANNNILINICLKHLLVAILVIHEDLCACN